MANCFHLCLMTAEETMLDEAAEYCRIPTADGSVGILADHAPMLCAVCEGEVRCRMEDGRERQRSGQQRHDSDRPGGRETIPISGSRFDRKDSLCITSSRNRTVRRLRKICEQELCPPQNAGDGHFGKETGI